MTRKCQVRFCEGLGAKLPGATRHPYNFIPPLVGHSKPDVIWYRIRAKVDPIQTGLALREMMISRAFEVYVNGERLMASGQVSPFVPYTTNSRILRRIQIG